MSLGEKILFKKLDLSVRFRCKAAHQGYPFAASPKRS